MPAYEYQCVDCRVVSEEFFRVAEKPESITCSECGGVAVKIMSAAMVQGDEMPAWMRHPETLGCLQCCVEKPIESRSEYKRYLKTNQIAEL